MPALYRTYRPKRFSEVIGQAHIVRTLRNAVVHDKPAHAYLFCGGRGLGKTTLARVLARTLNCTNVQDGEACLQCAACKGIDAGSFMDLLELDAASNTGVDNVRALIETVHYQPASGKYKVYIIDEAHMLSKGAWNALLKTLEEPPAHTIFVLATTEYHKVPATIHSRAQRFDFYKFSEQELADQIQAVLSQEKTALSDEAVKLIAYTANGGMRDALTLLDQVLSLGDNPAITDVEKILGATSKGLLVQLLHLIKTGALTELPTFFDELNSRYADMNAVNRDLLEALRQLLNNKLAPQAGAPQELSEALQWFSEQELLYLLRQYLRSYKELSATPDPVLPLLVASVEAAIKCGAPTLPSAPVSPPVQVKNTESAIVPSSTPSTNSSAPPLAQSSRVVAGKPESVAPATASSTSVVLDESRVREVWPDVCAKLKDVNGPLATLVRNSPICAVTGNTITLGVKYLFHKEQLESIKNRQLIAESLASFFGGSVRIVADFIERETAPVAAGETLGDALRIFGGELVE